MEVIIILLAIVFSVLVGKYAEEKNRSFGAWFFLSLCISPILGFIFCAIAGDKPAE